MPATHTVTITSKNPQYTVVRNGVEEPVNILKEEADKVYINYINLQKRFDEWLPKSQLHAIAPQPSPSNVKTVPQKRKRKTTKSKGSGSRGHSANSGDEGAESDGGGGDVVNGRTQEVVMTEEDYDIQHHKAQIGAVRNFDKVQFGEWLIRTWYFSPYPLTENEEPEPVSTNASVSRIPGVSRTRAEDLFAGGLHKSHGQHRSVLWVCDMCFKYMTDGLSWESHKKICIFTHPPGQKVYQRGAHIIWEVDGAKAKLYCQNLSLFGKLFIDIKTLYFDLDNFMFYILTDAAREKDHMMGYFCKEKLSFDDYNLACITTLPPYQRQGYGMLMIEFSYELSRRAGKTGTPERPLSDLGLRSYLAYWTATLVRFFRKLLSVLPPGTIQIFSNGIAPDLGGRSREGSEDGVFSPATQRRRRNIKGWEGEINDDDGADLIDINETINSLRSYVTTANPDGSASTHIQVQCSLADISRATNLRTEDAAFALNEMGMLRRWGHAPPPRKVGGSQSSRSGLSPPVRNGNSNGSARSVSVLGGSTATAGDIGNEIDTGYVIVLTREMIEKLAADRRVKLPCMRMQYVLL